MARWLIEIVGEPFDIEDYPTQFPEGDVFAIRQGKRVFLTGPRFDRAGTYDAVRDEAEVVLRELFGVFSLLWPSARLPTLGSVQYEHDDGRHDYFVSVGSGEMRIKLGSVSLGPHAQQREPQSTEGQALHRAVSASQHLHEAIKLITYPKSWGTAYRILEETEAHLGTTVQTAGLSTKGERDRFRRTANTAEVGGVTARHALERFEPPADPMTLDEGYKFIRHILAAVLRQE